MKVALVKIKEKNYYIGDCEDLEVKLVDHITDWAEIDAGDWDDLYRASRKYGYLLLALPEVKQQDFVAKTVADFREYARKEDEKTRKAQAEYKKALKKNEAKKKAAQLARLKAKLAALENEGG